MAKTISHTIGLRVSSRDLIFLLSLIVPNVYVDRARAQNIPYSPIFGALLDISVMSRPDVAYHTYILAKFLSDSSPECCDAAIHLMQYLILYS